MASEVKQIIAVVGPNGSGKSSALSRTQIDKALPFINPDDIARNSFHNIDNEDERNRRAWHCCNKMRDAMVAQGISFGFETVGSHPSKVELLKQAKTLGYSVALLFVATEDPAINIRRVRNRIAQGGHSVPDDKVVSRYYKTLGLLPEYFEVADVASVWDNSVDGSSEDSPIKHLVNKDARSTITVFPSAADVRWIQTYLLSKIAL